MRFLITVSVVDFKSAHREFQELVRELMSLRAHNLTFSENDPQDQLLLFAEGALVLIALERFLRIILGPDANDRDTLPNLLEKATGVRLCLLTLPSLDRQDAIRKITEVRNTLLHGNYEQAARKAGCSSVPEYFKKYFAAEVEALYRLMDGLVHQIDPATGNRR